EVHAPAGVRARLAGHVQFHPERMPVQACALVPGRHVGQTVRRFEGEALEDFHAAIVRPRRLPGNRGTWALARRCGSVRPLGGSTPPPDPVAVPRRDFPAPPCPARSKAPMTPEQLLSTYGPREAMEYDVV